MLCDLGRDGVKQKTRIFIGERKSFVPGLCVSFVFMCFLIHIIWIVYHVGDVKLRECNSIIFAVSCIFTIIQIQQERESKRERFGRESA